MLVLFLIGLPLALYKALKEPIWAAMVAGYFYFAIPSREFYVPEAPYQLAFWLIAIGTAWRYRTFGQRWARDEIDEVGRQVGRSVIEVLRPEVKRTVFEASLQAIDTETIREQVGQEMARRAFVLTGDLAPEALVAPVAAGVDEAVSVAIVTGAREARDVLERGRGDPLGVLDHSLRTAVGPVIDRALDVTVATAVQATIDELIRRDSAILGRRRHFDRGPLNYPLERTPILGLLTNSGLWLHLVFLGLTYYGASIAKGDPVTAMERVNVAGLLLIPMVAIVCSVRTLRHWRMFVWAWMAGVLHLSLNGIWLWVSYGGRADAVGGQANEANFLGAIAVLLCPVGLSMAVGETRSLYRLLGLGAAATYVVGIIACGSRGALLALSAGMGYWLLSTNRKLLALSVAAFGVAGFLAVAPESFWERMGTIVGSADTNPWIQHRLELSAQERVELWDLALKLFHDNRWMGIGPQQFVKESAEVLTITDAYAGERGMMTHNSWLQLAAEYGIIGTTVWTLNFALPILYFRRARKRAAKYPQADWFPPYCVGFEAGLLGTAIALTFSSYHWLDYIYWGMVWGPLTLQVANDTVRRLDWYSQAAVTHAPLPRPRYPRALEAVPLSAEEQLADEVWGDGDPEEQVVTPVPRAPEEVTHFVEEDVSPLRAEVRETMFALHADSQDRAQLKPSVAPEPDDAVITGDLDRLPLPPPKDGES